MPELSVDSVLDLLLLSEALVCRWELEKGINCAKLYNSLKNREYIPLLKAPALSRSKRCHLCA
jgi:hypothetical protein